MKRVFDIIASLGGLLLLSPLLLVLALLVRSNLGSPVLFRQQRPGLNGKPFAMYKFRTMTDRCDTSGNLLPDAERLTPFGRLLRASSLDELPELVNVLKGEMSLVGPRPLLMRYYPYFTQAEQERFSVRPGITGLAQISGRNDLGWDLRIEADLSYVRRQSLWLDLSILALTLWRVVNRSGLRTDPGASMIDFDVERRLRLAGEKRESISAAGGGSAPGPDRIA